MSTDTASWTDEERQLIDRLADMNEDDALALANRMLLEDKVDPMRVLGLCRAAMDVVGKRFEEGKYFLPELVLTGEMFDTIGAVARPLIKQVGGGVAATHDRALIGTVHGDLHDISIDVPAQKFVDEIEAYRPDVVALSGFLTLAFDSMKETIAAFDERGLRERFKVMIGGGQIDDTVRAYTGADAFGVNAVEAVGLCRGWMGVAA